MSISGEAGRVLSLLTIVFRLHIGCYTHTNTGRGAGFPAQPNYYSCNVLKGLERFRRMNQGPDATDPARTADLHAALVNELPHLRRFAFFLLGSRDRADDLVQETLARAVANVGRLRSDSNMRAWLFTIARNVARNDARRGRRNPVDHNQEVPEQRSVTSQTQDATGELRQLQTTLLSLPLVFRQTLYLCAIEGMSYEDAAAVLDVPIGTIRSRLARGRAMLQRRLDGTATGDEPDRDKTKRN
jgi:RNA polymerase sigma-70 factor (ECF subfamily)